MGGRGATSRAPFPLVLGTLLFLLVAAGLIAVAVGGVRLPLRDVVAVLLHALGLPGAEPSQSARLIVLGVRLPRIAVAAAAGAALAIAGSVLSGAFRNPLAEPVTTGTAGGALLGASLVLFVGPIGAAHRVGAPLDTGLILLQVGVAALVAWGATAVVVAATLRQGGRILGGPLLLAGLAVNAVVGSVAALLLFIGPVGMQTGATLIVSWTFGGLLDTAGAAALWVLLGVLLVSILFWLLLAHPLDLMLAGEEEAAAAGLSVGRVRLGAMAFAALLTGAAVGTVGVIAFVGLVAPVAMRRWTGPAHLRLVPAAALLGAVLLVSADAVGRALVPPAEVPAGVVTAALGAPFLLWLLARGAMGDGR